jgi:hypothetical protein
MAVEVESGGEAVMAESELKQTEARALLTEGTAGVAALALAVVAIAGFSVRAWLRSRQSS